MSTEDNVTRMDRSEVFECMEKTIMEITESWLNKKEITLKANGGDWVGIVTDFMVETTDTGNIIRVGVRFKDNPNPCNIFMMFGPQAIN